jgi:hypothetical protein
MMKIISNNPSLRKELLLVMLLLAISLRALAQNWETRHADEEPDPRLGWYYGLNMGSILPSNHSAGFYNGSKENDNSIARIVDNQYYKTQIVNVVGYNYTGYELPARMGYKPNFIVGGYAAYRFSQYSSFVVQANYSRLTATDIFLLNLDVPQGFSFEPTYLECQIMGQEERTYLDLGYRIDFPSGDKHNAFIETGLSMNNTRVLKNMIQIKTLEFSIKYSGEHSTGPYSQDPYYDIFQGGIGFGGFFTAGYSLRFNENISLDPMASFHFAQTNLYGYSEMKPGFNIIIRFTFRSFDF